MIYKELNDLIGICLSRDPKNRPTPEKIMEELYRIQRLYFNKDEIIQH